MFTYIFFILSIAYSLECQDQLYKYAEPEIKKGYIEWHKACPISWATFMASYYKPVECNSELKALKQLSTISYLKNINNANDDIALNKLFYTFTEEEPDYVKYLYSMASLKPLPKASSLAQSASLEFIEKMSLDKKCSIIDFSYKANCPYVGIKTIEKGKIIYSIFDSNESIEKPCYINDWFRIKINQPSPKAFINDIYFAISNESLIHVTDLKQRRLHFCSCKAHSSMYLAQQESHLLFIAENNHIIAHNLQSDTDKFLTFEAPITYMGIFEQGNTNYILQIQTTMSDIFKCYHFNSYDHAIREITELRHGEIELQCKEEFFPYRQVEFLANSWYISQNTSNYVHRYTHALAKIDQQIQTEKEILDDAPQWLACIDKETESGYSLLRLDLKAGFLFGYSSHWGYNAAGIALRFSLPDGNVLEFNYGKFPNSLIKGIYKTEYPETFVIQVANYHNREFPLVEYHVLHFPLIKKYLAYKNLTENQRRIQKKYDLRMQKINKYMAYLTSLIH